MMKSSPNISSVVLLAIDMHDWKVPDFTRDESLLLVSFA